MSISLGAYLKALRNGAGMGQREAAARAGVGSGYLSQIENGQVKVPSVRVVSALANAYGSDYTTVMRVTGHLPGDGAVVPPAVLEGLTQEELAKVLDYVAFLRWQRGRRGQ